MQDRFDEVNGIKLHALHDGEGNREIIIFLHGFPEFSYAWHRQIPFFAARGFHALAPDQRGYNLSSKPRGISAYTIDKLVADMAAWIKQITTQKVILVGHDWGGGVAWMLATQHPELLKKLVILNMPHLAVIKKHLKSNFKQMLKSWYVAFFQLPFLPEIACRFQNYRFLSSSLVRTANKNTFTNAEIDIYKKAWRQPYALTAMINWYQAYLLDATKTYSDVTIPTLIIWGKKDATLSAAMAKDSLKHCTQGKLIYIDDATHWLHHEKPDMLNELILNFVTGKH